MAKWFRKRRLGYGVSPQGAGGWAVTLVYVAALVGIAVKWPPGTASPTFITGLVVASVVYGAIIYATFDRDG